MASNRRPRSPASSVEAIGGVEAEGDDPDAVVAVDEEVGRQRAGQRPAGRGCRLPLFDVEGLGGRLPVRPVADDERAGQERGTQNGAEDEDRAPAAGVGEAAAADETGAAADAGGDVEGGHGGAAGGEGTQGREETGGRE